ncbi:MAG: hypothetical protein IKK94_02355, partial [Clostridia bacterium]|nr:hypothetical protein [Clostridia bacterium]
MKKITYLILALFIIIFIASCGEAAEPKDSETVQSTETARSTDTAEDSESETEKAPESEKIEETDQSLETDYPYDTSLPVDATRFSVKTPITYPRYEEAGYEYFGAQHLQGFCTDDALEYMYFSLTGMIVKVDMKTGEEAGKFIASRALQSKGFHMGDVTYHDGFLYSSVTFWGSDKTYIGVIKADDINGTIDETKADFKDENTILYGLLTPNCLTESKLPES